MERTRKAEWLTEEQLAQAQRMYEVMKEGLEEEIWRLACLFAGKKDRELFGRTEFEVRDHVLRMGAKALELAAEKEKKRGTKGAVRYAPNVGEMRDLSSGGRSDI